VISSRNPTIRRINMDAPLLWMAASAGRPLSAQASAG